MKTEISLTQQAFLSGTHDNPCYEASAVDADENRYTVQWDILENYDAETDEECDACDWSCPSKITRSGYVCDLDDFEVTVNTNV